MTTVFTTATDDEVEKLVRGARTRLAVIAPGVTMPVAEALAERMRDMPALSVTVILDADPEVYRMGYGDTEALNIIREASENFMFDLREQPGVRIGVVISDERAIVYAPVSRNVEAGSTSVEQPNAIMLDGAATSALAVASGATPSTEAEDSDSISDIEQEVGKQALVPEKVEKMQENLKENPPRPFDLTRQLTVFVSKVQYIELRISNAMLSSRKIRLPQHFIKLRDKNLRSGIKSTLDIPVDLKLKIKVEFEFDKQCEKHYVNEEYLKRLRNDIEKEYLHDWSTRGKIIFKKDKKAFMKKVERLINMTKAYRDTLQNKISENKEKFKNDMVAEFMEYWIQDPPEHLKRSGNIDKNSCKSDIESAAEKMFDDAISLKDPEATQVFKDISYEDITNEKLMKDLKDLMERDGVDKKTINELFLFGGAAAEKGSQI